MIQLRIQLMIMKTNIIRHLLLLLERIIKVLIMSRCPWNNQVERIWYLRKETSVLTSEEYKLLFQELMVLSMEHKESTIEVIKKYLNIRVLNLLISKMDKAKKSFQRKTNSEILWQLIVLYCRITGNQESLQEITLDQFSLQVIWMDLNLEGEWIPETCKQIQSTTTRWNPALTKKTWKTSKAPRSDLPTTVQNSLTMST